MSIAGKFDVGRLEVAMDDAMFVRVLQGGCNLQSHAQGVVGGDGAALEAVRQSLPLDQFHDQRPRVSRVFQAINGGNIGMVQRGEDLRFALETSHAVGVRGERLRQDLDGHVPVEIGVAGAVDLPHASAAQQVRDSVRPQPRALSQFHKIRAIICSLASLVTASYSFPSHASHKWRRSSNVFPQPEVSDQKESSSAFHLRTSPYSARLGTKKDGRPLKFPQAVARRRHSASEPNRLNQFLTLTPGHIQVRFSKTAGRQKAELMADSVSSESWIFWAYDSTRRLIIFAIFGQRWLARSPLETTKRVYSIMEESRCSIAFSAQSAP